MTTAWSSINDSRPFVHRPRHRQPAANTCSSRFRPRFELMEHRTLLATFSVTNTSDSGPGSLRQAILESNAAVGQTNTIDFAIPGEGTQTITPLFALPPVTQAVLIDGISQPGYSGTPLIELNGHSAGYADGLAIMSSGTMIRGLDINSFTLGAGILITGSEATGNTIEANEIGTDPTGSQALPNYYGVQILDGASDNLVGGTSPRPAT